MSAEIGFCVTIALTQFLAEYLISGFAIVLPNLFKNYFSVGPGSTGTFWPAALLSLILSASLLIFSRISDMHGGYLPFMFGIIWVAIWTLIPGLSTSLVMLDVSRAMQGLGIAAFMPSTFTMLGSIYKDGPRKNLILGLYGACAPLGFYAGFLVGGALPPDESKWYFFIAAAIALVAGIIGYVSVPHDRTDREGLELKMDWLGAFFITTGLILVAYALTVEPYVDTLDGSRSGFSYPMVLGPLVSGLVCLAVATWVEGWYAVCPLLPFAFFRPRGVKAFSLACLFFYGSFGVWVYNTSEYFNTPSVVGGSGPVAGTTLALWYTPMAVGGIIFCVVGGTIADLVPTKLLLMTSGLAWMGAPLIFAAGPIPLYYWSETLPSMTCATLGIDLTFTISNIFLSSSQPRAYQGVAGAVSSILVNLGMSFSLPISQIVNNAAVARFEMSRAGQSLPDETSAEQAAVWGYRATFMFAASSAALGFIICVLFFRLGSRRSETVVEDEERPNAASSETSTLVDETERRGRWRCRARDDVDGSCADCREVSASMEKHCFEKLYIC